MADKKFKGIQKEVTGKKPGIERLQADIDDLPENFAQQKAKNIRPIADAHEQSVSENSLLGLETDDIIDLPEALQDRAMKAWKENAIMKARQQRSDPQFSQLDEAEAWGRAIEDKDRPRIQKAVLGAKVVPSDGNPDIRPARVIDRDQTLTVLRNKPLGSNQDPFGRSRSASVSGGRPDQVIPSDDDTEQKKKALLRLMRSRKGQADQREGEEE